jgi:hypothetical protein
MQLGLIDLRERSSITRRAHIRDESSTDYYHQWSTLSEGSSEVLSTSVLVKYFVRVF